MMEITESSNEEHIKTKKSRPSINNIINKFDKGIWFFSDTRLEQLWKK